MFTAAWPCPGLNATSKGIAGMSSSGELRLFERSHIPPTHEMRPYVVGRESWHDQTLDM